MASDNEIEELRAKVRELEAALAARGAQSSKAKAPRKSEEEKAATRAARNARYYAKSKTPSVKTSDSNASEPVLNPSYKTSESDERTRLKTSEPVLEPVLKVDPCERVSPLTLPSSQISGEEVSSAPASERTREATAPIAATPPASPPVAAPTTAPLALVDGTRAEDALQAICAASSGKFQPMVSLDVLRHSMAVMRECGVTKLDCELLGESIATPPSWMRSAQGWQRGACTMALLLASSNGPNGIKERLLVHLVNHGRYLEAERVALAEAEARRAAERAATATKPVVEYVQPQPGRFAAMLREQAAARKAANGND